MRPGFFWRVGNGWNVDVLLPQSFINRVIYKLPIIVSKSPRSECMCLYKLIDPQFCTVETFSLSHYHPLATSQSLGDNN